MKVLCILIVLVAMVMADDEVRSVLSKFTSGNMVNRIKAKKIPDFKMNGCSVNNLKVTSFKVDSAKLVITDGKKDSLQLGRMKIVLKGNLHALVNFGLTLDIQVQSLTEFFDENGKQRMCEAKITRDKVTVSGWFGMGQRKYNEMNMDIKPYIAKSLCVMMKSLTI